ncbi:MazG nucleotide pyrophosphohydrolase domain-containing protein [Nevskia sp.]|uniref:MazG nucleotide pyrophosphohydrolase domain-containing protein n=1 Tax=Nevskia sp. TaxID=1929292 RepID=UPI0025FF02B0|nr:MazG nucleotide pyrophosphohydrolase domain-containing protein [Nevskia sp.]
MSDAADDPFAVALQIQRKCREQGFDWSDPDELWAKLDEEIAELREAATPEHRHEELGDVLFMVVNIARHLKLDPMTALAATNAKFQRRYRHVEAALDALPPIGDPERLVQMEALWQAAKAIEKKTC